jgi:hypothetical protein
MALTKFDREILSKAMSILQRENEFGVAQEIKQVLWKPVHR